MAGKTPPQLPVAADVQAGDLIVTWRGSGPMTSAPASLLWSSVPYLDNLTGAVSRPAYEKMKDWLNAKDYGVVANGVTDDTVALTNAINAAIVSGRPLLLPAGTILVTTAIKLALNKYPAYQTAFSSGLVIMGIGQGITVIDSRVVNDYWLSIDTNNPHTSTFQAVLGGCIAKLTIRNGAALANSSGIRLRACFQFLIEDVHIFDLSGTGINVYCDKGDLDSSVQVVINRCRIERCDKWLIDAATLLGNNEIGQLAIVDSFMQYGGLDESKAITGITQAATAVVTSPAHGYVNGAKVYLTVSGMTEVDSMVASQAYTVSNATTNTFELRNFANSAPINSSAFSAFTAGFVIPRDPQSGGIKWKGQQLRIINGGMVLCANAGLYIPGGSGLAQDVKLENFTTENCGSFGLLILGVRNFNALIAHFYFNGSFSPGQPVAGLLIDGQDTQCSNIIFEQPIVRATANETNLVYFKQFGANADLQTNRVRNIDYKQSDFAGQRRVEGFLFDSVPQQGRLVLTAATNVRIVANGDGSGAAMPLRLRGPVIGTVPSTTGEWVEYTLPSSGINQANLLPGGGALANNTTYNVYLYDANTTLGRPALELSTTAFSTDPTTGYRVKSDDSTRLWVGRVRTDGSAQFVITDTGYLNPEVIPAPVTGALAYRFFIANGWTGVKTGGSLPTSNTDFTFVYKPSSEQIVVFDPPSVAANSFVQADIAVTNVAAADHVLDVSRAGGWGDLVVCASVKAANVVRLSLFNGTASPIDLASANLFVEILKR